MNTLLAKLAAAVLLAATSALIGFGFGNSYGAASVQQKWDRATATEATDTTEQVITAREKESTHATQITEAVDTYQDQHADAAGDSAVRIADAERLQRTAESRAARYRDLSKASAAERDRLASHAAELDSSLAAGRIVVEKLRATVVERDQQLQLMAAVITADRSLAATGAPSSTDGTTTSPPEP